MKITLINHSDTLGGASVVTYRLMEALCNLGHDARMIVTRKASGDPRVALAGNRISRKVCFMAEHARIWAGCRFDRSNIFKISIATDGLPLHRHPLVQDADVVILNWVNQGMLSLRGIYRICESKPVIWTMHDMWCMTGVCHHAGKCAGFTASCGNCPLICHGSMACDMSRHTLERKRDLYRHTDIHFVAVSHWLADRARASSLMAESRLSVIPNAFPSEEFPAPAVKPSGRAHIVMGAARLDDPVKNLPLAVEALNIFERQRPGAAEAVFFGNLRDSSALDGLKMPFRHLGPVSDMRVLAGLYAGSHVVLSTSHHETLPGTVIEGMSAGCAAVSTADGGQADIIDHLKTGYLAAPGDAGDVARGIGWALDARPDPSRLHRIMQERFSAQSVAAKYTELIKTILK